MSEFEAIRGYLQRIDRWHDEFEPLVRELLELRGARAEALKRAKASPTVAGSKGQERENPAWATVLRLQAACDPAVGAAVVDAAGREPGRGAVTGAAGGVRRVGRGRVGDLWGQPV